MSIGSIANSLKSRQLTSYRQIAFSYQPAATALCRHAGRPLPVLLILVTSNSEYINNLYNGAKVQNKNKLKAIIIAH